MNLFRHISSAVLGVFFVISTAVADRQTANEEPKDNVYYKRAVNSVPAPDKNPLDTFHTANGIFEVRKMPLLPWAEWYNREKEGQGGSGEDDRPTKPAERKADMVLQSPLQGQLMVLHGEAYKEALNNGIKGPVGL